MYSGCSVQHADLLSRMTALYTADALFYTPHCTVDSECHVSVKEK
jgi:hypothetical protein